MNRASRLPSVTLYTRDGCHLCDDALAYLRRLAPELGLEIAVTDIDTDPALQDRYGLAVPVIALNGAEIARAPITEHSLRRRLRAALGG
jgi:glutaredoxin